MLMLLVSSLIYFLIISFVCYLNFFSLLFWQSSCFYDNASSSLVHYSLTFRLSSVILWLNESEIDLSPASSDTITSETSFAIYSTLSLDAFLDNADVTESLLAFKCSIASKLL